MRFILSMLLILSILLVPGFAAAKEDRLQKAPQHAFSKFPLKGLVNSSKIISKDGFSKARYRVNSKYQLICKAQIVVTNYPPRYNTENINLGYVTSISNFRTNVLFDAMDLTNPLKNSNHYISPDVVCGSYEQYYYLWLYQSSTTVSVTFLDLWGIAQIRWMSSQKDQGYFKIRWCRALTVGISSNFEYFKAIFDIEDRRIYYYSGMYPECTSRWKDVQRWQREGWYYIQ